MNHVYVVIDEVDIYTRGRGAYEKAYVQRDATNRRNGCQKASADGSYQAGINPLIGTS